MPHPVAWLGARLAAAEDAWNRAELPAPARFRRGLALTLCATLACLAAGLGLGWVLWSIPGGFV